VLERPVAEDGIGLGEAANKSVRRVAVATSDATPLRSAAKGKAAPARGPRKKSETPDASLRLTSRPPGRRRDLRSYSSAST
jgi:hypothetical protein